MPRKTCKRKSRVGDSKDISHSGNVNSGIVKKKDSGLKVAADSSPGKRETAFGHLTRRHSKTTGACPLAPKEDPEKLIKSQDKNTRKKIRRDIEEMDNRNPSSGRPFGDNIGGHTSMGSLLRSLSNGFDEVFPASMLGGSSQRLKSYIAMLNSETQEEQITGLTELCDYISISSEDTMISFPVEQVVPSLVEFLDTSSRPDVMLLAARAITLLADLCPASTSSIVRCGGLKALCDKLMNIEYIDVAEQSIQALEKLSHENAKALLREGALEALLGFIDFFQIGLQRVATATAANICEVIDEAGDSQIYESVMAATPMLVNLLSSSDSNIVQSACNALISVSGAYSSNCDKIESLFKSELVDMVTSKLCDSCESAMHTIQPGIFYGLVRLLSASAHGSSKVSQQILQSQILVTVASLFESSSYLCGGVSSMPFSANTAAQLLILIEIIDKVLPTVSCGDVASLDGFEQLKKERNQEEYHILCPDPTPEGMKVKDFLYSNQDYLNAVAMRLLIVLLNLQSSSVSFEVKGKANKVIEKVIFYSSTDCLESMREIPFSDYLSGLLRARDSLLVVQGLKLAALLLHKLPLIFQHIFLREGPAYEINALVHRQRDDTKNKTRKQWKGLIPAVASELVSEYFSNEKGELMEIETSGMKILTKIDEAKLDQVTLKNLIGLMAQGEVSTFEMRKSGVLRSLEVYLSGSDLNLSHLEERKSYFIRLKEFYGFLESGQETDRMAIFVKAIQNCLVAAENFSVKRTCFKTIPDVHSMLLGNFGFLRATEREAEPRPGQDDPVSSAIRALGTPVKLRLKSIGEDYELGSSIILIEPLATFKQISEYLHPKIRKASRSSKQGKGPGKHDRIRDSMTRITRSRARELEQMMTNDSDDDGDSYEMDSEEEASDFVDDYMDDERDMEEDVDMVDGEVVEEANSPNEEGMNSMNSHFDRAKEPSGSAMKTMDSHNEKLTLAFFVNGKRLSSSDTILKAIQQSNDLKSDENECIVMDNLWKNVHEVSFSIQEGEERSSLEFSKECKRDRLSWDDLLLSSLRSGMDGSALDNLREDTNDDVLKSISILENLSRLKRLLILNGEIVGGRDPTIRALLINPQMTSKVYQQMREALLVCSHTLPEWCTKILLQAPFLFPFALRRQYFLSSSFGVGRTLTNIIGFHSAEAGNGRNTSQNESPFRTPRITRQKVRISRSHVLDSARKVFDRFGDKDVKLEIEFYNEAGSGLGPTLEFYTLLSHEFQRKALELWRDDDYLPRDMENSNSGLHQGKKDLVYSSNGLFPKPHKAVSTNVTDLFVLLGKVMAKSIQDSRLMDIPISKQFYRLVLGKPLDLGDLREVAPDLTNSLEGILNVSRAKSDQDSIEDLCLFFVLPGDDNYELSANGMEIPVTSTNAQQYVDLVVDAILGSGIRTQVEAFKKGFNCIFPINKLRLFYEDEIELLVCGDKDEGKWTIELLSNAIKFDHGYTSSSEPAIALIKVMSSFDLAEQRKFLRFVTGAPRLPPGGLMSLNPRLTVVKKSSTLPPQEEIDKSDFSVEELRTNLSNKDLPSVMTCANYLKLPPYSDEGTLRERLLYAIREGQGSFDLS